MQNTLLIKALKSNRSLLSVDISHANFSYELNLFLPHSSLIPHLKNCTFQTIMQMKLLSEISNKKEKAVDYLLLILY